MEPQPGRPREGGKKGEEKLGGAVDLAGTRSSSRRTRQRVNRTEETVMRYISIFTHEKKNNVPPTPAEIANMGKLIEEGMRSGWLIATEGVSFGQEGVRVHKEEGRDVTVMDGPFTEAKEVIGGY